MKRNETTCADTDDGDLDARYAAGELSDGEAELFEEHFFACERCWSLVQRAVQIRAVESRAVEIRAVAARAPEVTVSRAPRFTRASRWSALAAAAVVVFVVGTWRAERWQRPDHAALAMRGSEDSLHVVTQTRGMTLVASWARAREASSYRVRLYSASGNVLHQREVTDTTSSVASASLPNTAPGAALYWEIQALNRTRQVVMRSGLREVRFPKPGG